MLLNPNTTRILFKVVTLNARTDECMGHVTTRRARSAHRQGEDTERGSGEENFVNWSS